MALVLLPDRGTDEPSFVPIAHLAHPDDPSKRTAMCGESILGIDATEPYETCLKCQILFEARGWEPRPE